MNALRSKYETTVQALCLRHGYAILVEGELIRLRELAIRGYTVERIVPHVFRSLQGALDYLCSLCGMDFINDYHRTFPDA